VRSFTLHKNARKKSLKKKKTFNTGNVEFVYMKSCKNHIQRKTLAVDVKNKASITGDSGIKGEKTNNKYAIPHGTEWKGRRYFVKYIKRLQRWLGDLYRVGLLSDTYIPPRILSSGPSQFYSFPICNPFLL